jgi:hypothetical protein
LDEFKNRGRCRGHTILFKHTKAERVMPAKVKVLGWSKGERGGMVVRGAGRFSMTLGHPCVRPFGVLFAR